MIASSLKIENGRIRIIGVCRGSTIFIDLLDFDVRWIASDYFLKNEHAKIYLPIIFQKTIKKSIA